MKFIPLNSVYLCKLESHSGVFRARRNRIIFNNVTNLDFCSQTELIQILTDSSWTELFEFKYRIQIEPDRQHNGNESIYIV